MGKLIINILILLLFISCSASAVLAVEVTPRISDREIVERLSRLEEVQKRLESRIDDLRSEMIARFEAVDKRFDAMDKRIDDLRSELWLFITIALAMFGFVIRMQWQMQKNQASMKTSLETQKDEINFLKSLIEKLLPPKSAL